MMSVHFAALDHGTILNAFVINVTIVPNNKKLFSSE